MGHTSTLSVKYHLVISALPHFALSFRFLILSPEANLPNFILAVLDWEYLLYLHLDHPQIRGDVTAPYRFCSLNGCSISQSASLVTQPENRRRWLGMTCFWLYLYPAPGEHVSSSLSGFCSWILPGTLSGSKISLWNWPTGPGQVHRASRMQSVEHMYQTG